MILQTKKANCIRNDGKILVLQCDYCGKRFERAFSNGRKYHFCRQKHYWRWLHEKGLKHKMSKEARQKISKALTRAGNGSWKGGRIYTDKGYVLILNPEHPNSVKDGYVFEHRLVMEKVLGRYLSGDELVHHKNGIKDDNRPENLEVLSFGEHIKRSKKKKESMNV